MGLVQRVNRRGCGALLKAATVVGALCLAACNKGATPDADQQITVADNISIAAGQSYAHVTYKPEVKVFEQAVVDSSLVGIDSEGHGAVFKNASAEIRALQAGDIFLVKNGFAVKVLGVETEGDQTVVITDRASLVDVLQEGEINVDSPVSFHGPKVAATQAPARSFNPLDLIVPTAHAGLTPDTTTGAVQKELKNMLVSGWTIEKWSVIPADGNATLSTRMTKDTDGFKAAVAMDGSITNFQFASKIRIPVQLKQVGAGIKGMSGHMHFVWEIGKDTPGVWAAEDRIKLPAGVTIPLGPVLEGLPLTLDISSAFLIHPALTGGKEYSKGGFTIDWVGSKSSAAQAIEADGAGGKVGLTFTITDDANISPVAPTGMVISVCAPRIELKLGLLGGYKPKSLAGTIANMQLDNLVNAVATRILSPSVYATLKASPLGKMSASKILTSNADVFVQVIHTEGVTHAPNMTLAPCSKIELKVTAQEGGDMQLFGLTDKAKSVTDIFTKTFTRWEPASTFCKSI